MQSIQLKQSKIVSFSDCLSMLADGRQRGKKIIQCHGVFDLLHPGHIRHFREAKSLGDILIVTVTPDRFVNKGPGRPAFTETLRLEALSALADVDWVILNDSPDAVSAIEKIRPHFYVKGIEYRRVEDDVTGKILEERAAVERVGGEIFYTNDLVFSSTALINKYIDPVSPEAEQFLTLLKQHFTGAEIIQRIEALADLKVLVIGDAIIDEYQYTAPLGQSGKGLHMVARCLEKDAFLGGSLIIANHIAQYVGKVDLIASVGKNCPYLPFVRNQLDPKVSTCLIELENTTSLVKKRYVIKDGHTLTKVFETYSGHEKLLNRMQTQRVIQAMYQDQYDLTLVCDFGNGFTNMEIIHAISDLKTYLALNTQVNSGNRGYNVVTNYLRADYISVNEPELRLSAHDRESRLEGIAEDICSIMKCQVLSVTQGVHGVVSFHVAQPPVKVPAFATHSIDRIGAGDSYLSLSSLCFSKGYPTILSSFVGSVAAALSVGMIGNKEAIQKVALCKFIQRLMK